MAIYNHEELVNKCNDLQLQVKYFKSEYIKRGDYIKVLEEDKKDLLSQLKTMTENYESFLQLSKNLDRDFNNGKIFKR